MILHHFLDQEIKFSIAWGPFPERNSLEIIILLDPKDYLEKIDMDFSGDSFD